MRKSEQIKEAPADARQVFKNFVDATAELMDCDGLPAGVEHALSRLLDEFGGNDVLDTADHARRVMSRVFELDEEEEEEKTEEAPAPEEEEEEVDDEADERKAARELAYAFAVIEEYAAYLPKEFYKFFQDLTVGFFADANWQSDPELLRRCGPHILRAAIKNLAAKEGA